ncbi:hypothetical protein [Azospirillum sp. SYSU D00513]|uniref:hypothetical protein n=1 Tax=Azospirillum sp. SYSU D00513 TaxID=2812561 RepID=UPI001A97C5A3|nr:hypothetical protein [Azospirillum sp. SYSU D00513]
MLHIKDIEAFASINEALNRPAAQGQPAEVPPRDEAKPSAPPTAAELFARMLGRR